MWDIFPKMNMLKNKKYYKFSFRDTKNIVLDLQKKMDFYSDKKDYERAAIYRDKIQSIRDTQKETKCLNRI